jgi:hypothetical protein
VLSQYADKAGSDSFISACRSVDIKSFDGQIGNNYTGASVGGFEISSNKYLVAYEYEGNVYLGSVSKSNFSSAGLKTRKLTSYAANSSTSACTPVLVKLSDKKFVIMWETEKSYRFTNKIKYVVVDQNGKKLTSVQTVSGSLSDCQPVASGNQITWYVTDSSTPVFYKLNLTTGKIVKLTMK